MPKPFVTTVQVPPTDRRDFRDLADPMGLKLKHIPRLLLEGWKLLTPDQIRIAREQFEKRQPRRRQPATASA